MSEQHDPPPADGPAGAGPRQGHQGSGSRYPAPTPRPRPRLIDQNFVLGFVSVLILVLLLYTSAIAVIG